MNAGLLIIILLLGLALLGFPIYIALGIGALAALNLADLPLIVLPQRMFAGMNGSALLAIPFFILAGNIMSRSITGKLIDICNAIIGHIKGSLSLVTILASALFGAISGSGVATASAIGGITIPAMKREGYPAPFAVGVASISSILGPIIPPSIVLIVYASITNVSVAELFLGSVLPGIILAVALIAYGLYYGHKHNLPAHEKPNLRKIGASVRKGIWALLMPIIILGGIFGGIFTPTEASAVAVVYSLIISLFVYKDMSFKELPQVFVEGAVSTATIMVMVGLSSASSYVITTSGLPQQLVSFFSSITNSPVVILLLLNILFLIIGMLMEANAADDDPDPAAAVECLRHRSAAVRHRHELQPLHRSGDAAGGPVSAAVQPDRRNPAVSLPEGHDAHAADLHYRVVPHHLCLAPHHLASQHHGGLIAKKGSLGYAKNRIFGNGRHGTAYGEKRGAEVRAARAGLRCGPAADGRLPGGRRHPRQ